MNVEIALFGDREQPAGSGHVERSAAIGCATNPRPNHLAAANKKFPAATPFADFRDAITLYERCGFSLSSFVPNNSGHFPLLVEMDCIMINNRLRSAMETFLRTEKPELRERLLAALG